MTVLHMETDVVRAVAEQIRQSAEQMHDQVQAINRSVQGIDWLGPDRDEFVVEIGWILQSLNAQVEAGMVLAQRVNAEADEWEQLDSKYMSEMNGVKGDTTSFLNGADRGASFGVVAGSAAIPLSVAAATQTNPVEGYIERLDDLLKPIDWISDSKKASKLFTETLKNIGRFANSVTGQRGNIKTMSELGQVLTGTAKTVGAASNLLALRDFSNYFSGHLSNQQIADQAVRSLLPVPVLNSKISAWLTQNMPDPNGIWRGLVPKVQ